MQTPENVSKGCTYVRPHATPRHVELGKKKIEKTPINPTRTYQGGTLAHGPRFPFARPSLGHEFDLKRVEALCLRSIGIPGLHLNLGPAHGTATFGGLDMQGGVQALGAVEVP